MSERGRKRREGDRREGEGEGENKLVTFELSILRMNGVVIEWVSVERGRIREGKRIKERKRPGVRNVLIGG